MLTKGAIGNLVNRYKAVLKKCNLINAFGSLAVASLLVLGGAGVAGAAVTEVGGIYYHDGRSLPGISNQQNWTIAKDDTVWINDSLKSGSNGYGVWIDKFSFVGEENSTLKIEAAEGNTITYGLGHSGTVDVTNLIIKTNDSCIGSYGNMAIKATNVDLTSNGNGIFIAYDSVGTTLVSGDNLTINAGGNGIRNHGTVGHDLTVTSKNVEINANSGIYSSNAANTTIASDGDVTITAKNNGINVNRSDTVTNIGKVAVNGANVTIEAESGHAVTADIARINSNDTTPVVSITATENVSITAKDSSMNAVYARLRNPNSTQPNISVNIEAGGALDVNGAVKLMDVKENSVLKGKTVFIEASAQALNVQNAWVEVIAEESIDIISTNSYGIFTNYGAGDGIKLDAEKVSIEGAAGAINAAVSNANGAPKVDINANQIEITGDISAADKSSVSLGGTGDYADGYTANIAGDITAGADSTITLDLGKSGSLTGAVNAADMAADSATGVHLDLGEGSTWTATGDSNVTSLAGNDITVNIAAGTQVEATSLTGNGGNINMVDANSSFIADNADTEATFLVQAIDADGNVKNADEVSSATLAAMMSNVDVTDTEGNAAATSASAADGIVNNGFTITTDEQGNPVISGGGVSSVTKAVLEAASVNTVSLDRILTNDVRKRMGDLRSDKNESGVWMRWDGGKLKGNSGLTNEFNTIQIGGDTKVGKNCRLGVAGSFTHGDSEFDRGNGQLEGFSFATYATWMGDNGMFADVVARLGHFSTEMNVEGLKGDMDNRVFSLSGEYGWHFNVCEQFFVEPQAELAYTYVSSEDLEFGDARYSFDNVNSLTGRLGLVAGWNLPNDMGNVYARASVLQQFMGDAKVTGFTAAGATPYETDGNDTWLEYGIGANIKLTDKTYIWADVERTEGAEIDEEWRGTVGFRFSF